MLNLLVTAFTPLPLTCGLRKSELDESKYVCLQIFHGCVPHSTTHTAPPQPFPCTDLRPGSGITPGHRRQEKQCRVYAWSGCGWSMQCLAMLGGLLGKGCLGGLAHPTCPLKKPTPRRCCALGIPTKPRLVRVLKHLWQHLGGRRDAWLPNTMLAEALALCRPMQQNGASTLSPHHMMTDHSLHPLQTTNPHHTSE